MRPIIQKTISFLIFILLCNLGHAESESAAFVSDIDEGVTPLQNQLKKKVSNPEELEAPHIQSDLVTQEIFKKENVKKDSSDFSGNHLEDDQTKFNKDISKRDELNSFGITPMGLPKSGQYLEHKNSEILEDLKGKANSSYSFLFMKDNYAYKNSSNNFSRTFRDESSDQLRVSADGKKHVEMPLIFKLTGHHFYYRGFFSLAWGVGAGLGYNAGKGYFVDGTRSNARFSLWTIPVDLSIFYLEMPLTSFLTFSTFAGPSVLGVIQNRSDLPDTSDRKQFRQMSGGYFAAARANLALSQLFPLSTYDVFGGDRITRYFLTLEGHYNRYKDFKSVDLEVSGTSFGAGLTFEFL